MFKKFIKQEQVNSLKRVLKDALEYHYSNFKRLEEIAEPYSLKEIRGSISSRNQNLANTNIKFEIQSYINHLRRLKHFIYYIQKVNHDFKMPEEPELKQVWSDIMNEDGVVNMLANKWAVHRSVDYPKGENYQLHLEVLLNLEGAITMWGNGHIYLSIGTHSFYLYDYHPRAKNFIYWVFKNI